jgi:molybdate transport system substrate-binding protein
VVETDDLDRYIKTIPAASLSYCDDPEALEAFLDFLSTDAAKSIWIEYGYEVLN